MALELIPTSPEICKVPGCVLLRVNSVRRPVDTVGIHVHPGKSEPLPRLLGAAIAKVLEDKRLSP